METKDDNHNNLPTSNHLSLEDKLMQFELEEALLRQKFKEPNVDESWKEFEQQVRSKESLIISSKPKYIIHRWIGVASVAALLAGIIFMISNMSSVYNGATKPMQQIVASSSAAQEIVLEQTSDADSKVVRTIVPIKEIAIQNVDIDVNISSQIADYTQSKQPRIRHNVVSIPRGKVYKLLLKDSTEVWLNADSRLSFPSNFTGSKREVTLDGEAYFKVAHNPQKPFIVHTAHLTTEVLGTEFNIKSFGKENSKVTLINGSVKVQISAIGAEVLMASGDEVDYKENRYEVNSVDTSYYINWRDGYFYFDNSYLVDILQDLGKWYNIFVELEEDEWLRSQRLHFVAEQSEKIDDIVEHLNAYNYLKASFENGILKIMRKYKK